MRDSTQETLDHINQVRDNIGIFLEELERRGLNHDASKLKSPEKDYFDKAPDISQLEFGYPEYKASCDFIKPALEHHYKHNDHHFQHFENGIKDMNLFQLVEMFCDWRAAVERTKNGDIYRSIDLQSGRFGISKQLKQILINTEDYIRNEIQG